MALFTAAAMHDYDHPGRTNAFLVATRDGKVGISDLFWASRLNFHSFMLWGHFVQRPIGTGELPRGGQLAVVNSAGSQFHRSTGRCGIQAIQISGARDHLSYGPQATFRDSRRIRSQGELHSHLFLLSCFSTCFPQLNSTVYRWLLRVYWHQNDLFFRQTGMEFHGKMKVIAFLSQ